jgi:hypothetical protein
MAARRKPQKVKTVRYEDYTPLEIHAIQIREFYLALRKAGFAPDMAMGLCTDSQGWPDWFKLPAKEPEDIGTIIDDEDDD